MSQENVEIVRCYFEHLDQQLAHYWANPVPISQYPLLEEAFNAIAPDAEWKPPFMGKPVRGRDAWLALVSGWLEAADDWRIKVEDVSDLGGEHVLCVHVAFAVEDIDAVVAGLRARGAELVGELERYEDSYRLCYVRGPEGIIVELAEQIG